MPPAISDDDDSVSSENDIPSKVEKESAKKVVEEEEDEEDEEDEDDEEEYVVDKIISHLTDDDGSIKYEIKWMGYERKSDRTWEPEDNLEGAREALEEYWAKIGGRPTPGGKKRKASSIPAGTPAGKGRGRGRKPKEDSLSIGPEAKPVKQQKQPDFPKGSWEDHIQSVDTIEEVPDEAKGVRRRYGMVVWNDGRKTRHELAALNQKCPQKMLAYYEQHLYFNYA